MIYVERTTIGGITIAGYTVWTGWPMIAAILATVGPSILLGREKLERARRRSTTRFCSRMRR